MRKLIEIVAKFCAMFYSARVAQRWNNVRDIFYTHKACKKFAHVGANPLIMRKIKVLGGENITIGDNFCCYWGQRIETYIHHNGKRFSPSIIIGNNVSINPDCHIACVERVEIGNNVLFASRIFVTDHFHGDSSDLSLPPAQRPLTTKGAVIIKDNVWLGEGVCVMPGVTIGRNVIIGANSVVTKDIPDNAIAAGVPAEIIRYGE